MLVSIKRPITKEKLDQVLELFRKNKRKGKAGNLKRFFGISPVGLDPVKTQKKLRNEWD